MPARITERRVVRVTHVEEDRYALTNSGVRWFALIRIVPAGKGALPHRECIEVATMGPFIICGDDADCLLGMSNWRKMHSQPIHSSCKYNQQHGDRNEPNEIAKT